MNLYCDIDGTLTDDGFHPWGNPNEPRIEALKAMIARGDMVVIWSACGESYARQFCAKYGIEPHAVLSKPDYVVDDQPTLRPRWKEERYQAPQFLILHTA